MDIDSCFKNELHQGVSHEVKPNRKLHAQRGYMACEHSHQNHSNDRDIVKPGEDANDLPEPLGRIL